MLHLPEAASRAPETLQAYRPFPGRFSSTCPTLHFFVLHSTLNARLGHTCRPVVISIALATASVCNGCKVWERQDTEPETPVRATHGERHNQQQTTALATFPVLFQELARTLEDLFLFMY